MLHLNPLRCGVCAGKLWLTGCCGGREHTAEVLREAGYDEGGLEELREAGIIA